MIADVIKNAETKMTNSVKGFQVELGTLRTGHASPSLLEHIKADYAGVPTPLNQLATVSAPEARLLVIRPWDRSSVSAIEKAIMKSDLGLNPSSDGTIIRIAIPPLSEERRQDMIKIVRKWAEERRVVIRNLRHEVINELKKMEKDKEISQDEQKRAQDQIQKITDAQIVDVDNITREKEKELMEV